MLREEKELHKMLNIREHSKRVEDKINFKSTRAINRKDTY